MIVNTFERCVEAYRSFNAWDAEYDLMRRQFLASLPNSVIVEGEYSELDMAVNWCLTNIGQPDITSTWKCVAQGAGESQEIAGLQNGQWANQWFYKTDYDYGFMEFYFRSPADPARFVEAVPSFSV